MANKNRPISVNKLLMFKNLHLATIERQQVLYRISLKNPLYKTVDEFRFYSILNQAANIFHFTVFEICALSILLESLNSSLVTNAKQTVMFASFVIKTSFSDKLSFYENLMKKYYKNFNCRLSN